MDRIRNPGKDLRTDGHHGCDGAGLRHVEAVVIVVRLVALLVIRLLVLAARRLVAPAAQARPRV